jgi:hypothetical protein
VNLKYIHRTYKRICHLTEVYHMSVLCNVLWGYESINLSKVRILDLWGTWKLLLKQKDKGTLSLLENFRLVQDDMWSRQITDTNLSSCMASLLSPDQPWLTPYFLPSSARKKPLLFWSSRRGTLFWPWNWTKVYIPLRFWAKGWTWCPHCLPPRGLLAWNTHTFNWPLPKE